MKYKCEKKDVMVRKERKRKGEMKGEMKGEYYEYIGERSYEISVGESKKREERERKRETIRERKKEKGFSIQQHQTFRDSRTKAPQPTEPSRTQAPGLDSTETSS